MQTFPLELDNALLTFNLFSIYQIVIQLNFFSWNVSHLNWHFGVIGLRISFWIFFSFSSFGTMILLLWFLIFKFLSIFSLFYCCCVRFFLLLISTTSLRFIFSLCCLFVFTSLCKLIYFSVWLLHGHLGSSSVFFLLLEINLFYLFAIFSDISDNF